MSQVSEIKCPACGKWSNGTNKIDEKCPYCGAYINPGRVHYLETNRMHAEQSKKASYLVIKPTDDPLVQMAKQFTNWLRWATFYGISVIYIVIALMVIAFGLAML